MSAVKVLAVAVAGAGALYAAFGPAGVAAPSRPELPEPIAAVGPLGAGVAHFDQAEWRAACRAAALPELELPAGVELQPARRLVAESRAWTRDGDGDALGRMGEIALALDLNQVAVDLFAAATELGTERARWLYLLGTALQQEGRLAAAVDALSAAVALDPTVGVAQARIARALFELGQDDAARVACEACLRSPDMAALGHVGLARLALRGNAAGEAVAHLDAAAQLAPGDYVVWQLRAQALAGLGRDDESARDAARAAALPRYRGWLSFDPVVRQAAERARTYNYVEGLLLQAQGRGDAAAMATLADELAERLSGDAETWRRAALSHTAAGHLDAARQRVERALAVGPPTVPVLVSAAEIVLAGGDHQRALELAEQAVSIDPRSSFAHEIMGRAAFMIGQRDEGLVHARRAVELAPSVVGHRRVLVEILVGVQRVDEARRELAALLVIAPGNVWAEQRLAGLPSPP